MDNVRVDLESNSVIGSMRVFDGLDGAVFANGMLLGVRLVLNDGARRLFLLGHCPKLDCIFSVILGGEVLRLDC